MVCYLLNKNQKKTKQNKTKKTQQTNKHTNKQKTDPITLILEFKYTV